MILRPQQKRTKEHKNLMNSIAKGDEVLTNGGLVGRVTKVAEKRLHRYRAERYHRSGYQT